MVLLITFGLHNNIQLFNEKVLTICVLHTYIKLLMLIIYNLYTFMFVFLYFSNPHVLIPNFILFSWILSLTINYLRFWSKWNFHNCNFIANCNMFFSCHIWFINRNIYYMYYMSLLSKSYLYKIIFLRKGTKTMPSFNWSVIWTIR